MKDSVSPQGRPRSSISQSSDQPQELSIGVGAEVDTVVMVEVNPQDPMAEDRGALYCRISPVSGWTARRKRATHTVRRKDKGYPCAVFPDHISSPANSISDRNAQVTEGE
jgi:hypothetical protein